MTRQPLQGIVMRSPRMHMPGHAAHTTFRDAFAAAACPQPRGSHCVVRCRAWQPPPWSGQARRRHPSSVTRAFRCGAPPAHLLQLPVAMTGRQRRCPGSAGCPQCALCRRLYKREIGVDLCLPLRGDKLWRQPPLPLPPAPNVTAGLCSCDGLQKESAGYRLMAAMGWREGEGLGAAKQGIKQHIKVKKKFENWGVGAVSWRRALCLVPHLAGRPVGFVSLLTLA